MARANKPRTTNAYSPEFKLKAVLLSQVEGVQSKDVAEALGIHPNMLSLWRQQARDGVLRARVSVAVDARSKADVRAFATLKRKHAMLVEEHELLKKAIRFTSDRKVRSSPSSTKRRTGSA